MNNTERRPRGRPRNFDRDEALAQALNTFWAKGYDSTSLDDLTESMGINRPSLYGSFGSKQDLFLETIDLYGKTIGRKPSDALEAAENIQDGLADYLETTIQCVTSKDHPSGCLINNVASERSVNDPEVRDRFAKSYKKKVNELAGRFERAKDEGELPADADSLALARMLHAIMQSLASRARVGATRKELRELADSFQKIMLPALSKSS